MAETAQEMMKSLSVKYTKTKGDSFLSSGSIIFDSVLSKGKGIPRNKFIQISSASGLGKSTAVLHFCKAACAQGLDVAYLDSEKAVNDSQLEGIGLMEYLDTHFFLYQISTYEEAEEVCDKALTNPNLAYIIVDSLTWLISEKLLEQSVSDVLPGLDARMIGSFLRKYKTALQRSKSECTFIFINQMRNKLNFRGQTSYKAAGGEAQEFGMDIRLMFTKNQSLERQTEGLEGKKAVPYGANINVYADKNRYNRPNIVGVMTVIYGKGISNISAYQRILEKKGLLTKAGSWYELAIPDQEPLKGQGTTGIMKVIKDNIEMIAEYIESVGGFALIEEVDE